MDIAQMLSDLRSERAAIEQAIRVLERIASGARGKPMNAILLSEKQ